jgi:multisubunit Na+/H+ antiporter MnhB subunit
MTNEKYVIGTGFVLMAIAAGYDSVTTGAVSPLLVVALVGLAFLLGALSQSPDALEN